MRRRTIRDDEKSRLVTMISEAYQSVNEDVQYEEENYCQLKLNQKLIELLHQETRNVKTSNRLSTILLSPKYKILKFQQQLAKYNISKNENELCPDEGNQSNQKGIVDK